MAAVALTASMVACDDLFEPANENIKDINKLDKEPGTADGVLGSAYILMPYPDAMSQWDVATDDAVSNDLDNGYMKIAVGGWTAENNLSADNYRDRNASIQFVNQFLSIVDNVTFSTNAVINEMFRDRLKGEAYALRVLNMYHLLQNYGGRTASGELMGVHIWTTPYDATIDMNVSRDTYAACMQQLFDDADKALELLPTDYVNVSSINDVPAKYRQLGVDDPADYTRVFGAHAWTRMSGRIVEAIRAQAALLASSPAFADGSGVTSAQAADYAADILDRIGGVAGLSEKGHLWYTAEEMGDGGGVYANHAEILWRGGITTSTSALEADNFPPTIYGKGRINPTQNLVDAFPMQNGYPITDSRSNYDAANPYAGRDPRLEAYIVVNKSTMGVSNSTINTAADSETNDGLNKESGYSTRTGYYMRKHLRNDVNPNPAGKVEKARYTKRIRYTEIFLAYAEAANEAWGPTGNGTHSYSAYDVIKAIRHRAGVGTDNGDPYLESVKTSKDEMRKLIRNERRLELCFENLRFWDLRRWNADLNETAKGVSITGTTFTPIDVENRRYSDYMVYGPLPYTDVLKFSNLEQNQGW
jgi:SusD family.